MLKLENLEPTYVANFIAMVEAQGGTIERWLMTTNEIKLANLLVKADRMQRGHADTKQGQVQFSLIKPEAKQ